MGAWYSKQQKEEQNTPLPTDSTGAWYSKQQKPDDDDKTSKNKKGKRKLALSPMQTKKLFDSSAEKRRAKDGKWYTKDEFYDYYMVEGVGYAYEQWQKAVRDTKVKPELSWVNALRPDIDEEWGKELAAKYDEVKSKPISTVKLAEPPVSPHAAGNLAFETTQDASTSSDNAPKQPELDNYAGFVQQYEEDDEEIDFGDDETFSAYVMKQMRHHFNA